MYEFVFVASFKFIVITDVRKKNSYVFKNYACFP